MPNKHCSNCECTKPVPKQGMRFESPGGEIYILAMVDYTRYALIGLSTANRWSEPATLAKVRKEIEKSGFRMVMA